MSRLKFQTSREKYRYETAKEAVLFEIWPIVSAREHSITHTISDFRHICNIYRFFICVSIVQRHEDAICGV